MKRENIKYDPADFEPIKRVALLFPGAEESVSHENTPSIKVRGKLMCRLHDNGEFIPIHLDFEKRDEYLIRILKFFFCRITLKHIHISACGSINTT